MDISKHSKRNKRPYKRKDALSIYTLDNMVLWGYERKFMEDISIDLGDYDKDKYLDFYNESNRYFKYYASLSSVLVRFAVFQSTLYTEVAQKDSLSFVEEYFKFRDRYDISLSSLLSVISNAYPFHRFNRCFQLLYDITALAPDFFKRTLGLSGRDSNRFPPGLEDQIKHLVHGADFYHREMQLVRQADDNFFVSKKHIENSVRIIEENKGTARTDVFILWFQCWDLIDRRIQIKQVLSMFFKRLKALFKNSKAFYIKQVSFDTFVGLQLDLVLTYEGDRGVYVGRNSYDFGMLNPLVVSLWKQCCLDINSKAIAKAVWICDDLKSGDAFILMHWHYVCNKSSFIKLDLPLIRAFSKGKLHEG